MNYRLLEVNKVMCEDNQKLGSESPKSSHWGLLGIAAFVGIAAAAYFLVNNRRRSDSRHWSFEDLMDAADTAAANLERGLAGESARAS